MTGIDRPKRMPHGSPDLEPRVLALAPDHTAAEIAARVGRTRQRVSQILAAHGAAARPALKGDGQPRRDPRRPAPDAGRFAMMHGLRTRIRRAAAPGVRAEPERTRRGGMP